MCNWGISRAYESLSNQDHYAVFCFMKTLLNMGLTNKYEVNMFLAGIGSGYRLSSYELTTENDWAESIASIINGSIRRRDDDDKEDSEED